MSNIKPVDYERALIGSAMISKVALVSILDSTDVTDYSHTGLVSIYSTIKKMHERDIPIDMGSVLAEVSDEKLKNLVVDVSDNIVTNENIDGYIKVVREASQLRKFLKHSDIIKKEISQDKSHDEIVDEIEKSYNIVRYCNATAKIMTSKECVVMMFTDMENRHKKKDFGIKTGIKELDETIGYLTPGELWIVAGRPSMGKTSLLGTMMYNMCNAGLKVGYISLEESRIDNSYRMICINQQVNLFQIKKGFASKRDMAKVGIAAGEIANYKLFVDDTPDQNSRQIRTTIRQMVILHGVQIVFVDHLHLFNLGSDNENTGYDKATKDLKAAAKELCIPVVASAQLNRPEKKSKIKKEMENGDKVNTMPKPTLTDLRASGGIEQNADGVIFVHREEYYTKHIEDKGNADLIIAKQRFGPIGEVQVEFVKESAYFRSKEAGDQW